MGKFKSKLYRFMYGRYGTDKLGMVIIWTALVVMIINSFINSLVLYLLEELVKLLKDKEELI